MAFQPVTHGAEAVVNMAIGSIPFVNVFGYDIGAGAFGQAEADAIGSVLALAYGEIDGYVNDGCDFVSCVITDLRTETGGQFTAATPAAGAYGTHGGEALPFQTAALISWSTDTRGRSYRGRTYLGGFDELYGSGRSIDGALQASLGDFAGQLIDDGGFGVISRYHGVDEDGVPIPRDPAIITQITGAVIHPNWRTQRRRALATG